MINLLEHNCSIFTIIVRLQVIHVIIMGIGEIAENLN